jgi:hypothetical protein
VIYFSVVNVLLNFKIATIGSGASSFLAAGFAAAFFDLSAFGL